MNKISGLVFMLLAVSCFAQDAEKGSPFVPRAVDGLARSQASIGAEARVREMETLLKLTTEGKALYETDEQKRTGYQYCRMAVGLAHRGEFRLAIREASKALFLGQSQRNEDLVAHAKRDLAISYSYAGNIERAQQYAQEALNHYVDMRNRQAVHSWAYKVLGDVAIRRGEFQKAIDMYEKSISMNDGNLRFFARASLASAYVAAGDPVKAADALKQAESYLDVLDARWRPGAETALQRIKGNLALKQGKPQEAQQLFAKAVTQTGGQEQDYQKFWALEGRGRAQVAQGDKAGALQSYLEALAASEHVRARFRNEEINTGLFGEMQQAFNETVRLSMEAGNIEAAWEASERGRARVLLDLVRNRVKLASGTEVFTDPLGKPVNLAELQTLLKSGEVLIEYHVLQARTHAWAVRNSSVNAATIEVSRDQLANLVESLRDAVRQQKPAAGPGGKLYDTLLQPLGLKDGEALIVVPHDMLHYVPFQALHDGNVYLIEKSALSYSPSASALAALLASHAAKTGRLLAFGNPDLGDPQYALPGAQREVESIKALFTESETYFQREATKQRLFTSAPKSNLVHIAAHAEVDVVDPLYSRILFAPEGKAPGALEAHEVYGMNLKGLGLVALSACESGLGRVSRGDEIWGFTRSFLSAGSPALIVSLWPVADESTELLMTSFYQNLSKGDARAALRAAQLNVMKDPRFSHPFYWAPFDLIGDWR